MSNESAVKLNQLSSAIKQMSDFLNGKIDGNTTQLNEIFKTNKIKMAKDDFQKYINIYIAKNGLTINGETATEEEVYDYVLNKDCYKYRGKLNMVNGKLIDKFGKKMPIRGVGLHHIIQYKNLHTKEMFESLKYYGFNCIRIPLYLEDYDFDFSGTPTPIAKGYLSDMANQDAHIEEIVDICTELGMYVILDWHVMGLGAGTVLPSQAEALKTTQAQEFFTKYTTKYAKRFNIIYETANEPYTNTIDEVVNHTKACYDIIRANTKSAIIVTGNTNKGSTKDFHDALVAQGMSDVFVSIHSYALDNSNKIQGYLDDGIPMFVTEWGNSTGDSDTAFRHDELCKSYIRFLNDNIIPSCCWKLTDQNHGLSLLLNKDGIINNSCYKDGVSAEDLSENGKVFFNTYRENAFLNIPTDATNELNPLIVLTDFEKKGYLFDAEGKLQENMKEKCILNIPIVAGHSYKIYTTDNDRFRLFASTEKIIPKNGEIIPTKIVDDNTKKEHNYTPIESSPTKYIHLFLNTASSNKNHYGLIIVS